MVTYVHTERVGMTGFSYYIIPIMWISLFPATAVVVGGGGVKEDSAVTIIIIIFLFNAI